MQRLRAFLLLLFMAIAAPAMTPSVMAQSVMERLVTPGPLSASHARLESRCDSCHSSFSKEAQNGKCVACHRGVGADIASQSRFHGKFAPARTQTCKSCHSEHKGRGFGLIRLNRATFNHAFTDYALTGAHTRVNCAGCHGPTNNYRGVSVQCADCHRRVDPHRGQLGAACQTCHVTAAWKQVKPFDHARTGFALAGAHRTAACLTCHQGQRWKGLATTCVSCHARDDAHRGSRGTNCASCHTSATWRSATFDHASTGFPLAGSHAAASCASCHGANNAVRHPVRTCIGCHTADDVHKGSNGTNCASCHSAQGWKQVSFDHDKMTGFPLRGVHRRTTCNACHKQPARVVSPPVTCFGCHAQDDIHKGGNGMDCARCHSATGWKTTNFNHDTMTDFPLRGKHALAKCAACHVKPASEVPLSMECGSCHTKDDVHVGKLGQACSRCHDSDGWKLNVRFDHALSRFPLLGKHAAVQCVSCHADKTFAAKGLECASCHVNDHHKGTLGTPSACQSCHNTYDWKAWNFDHDVRTDFPLTGRHKGLICAACHGRAGDPAKTASRCIDCHRRNDPHRGQFGEQCETCHVTDSFQQIIMRQDR